MQEMLNTLARRSFAACRVRNLIAVLAIALCSTLFTSITAIGIGTLQSITLMMQEQYGDRPAITMAMAGQGVISRLSGEIFGSCVTFGCAGQASAPGQLQVEELDMILETIHKSLGS